MNEENPIPLNPRAAAAVLLDECDFDTEKAKALARKRLSTPEYAELREILWRAAIDLEIDQLWRSGRSVRIKELGRAEPMPVLPPRRLTPPRVLKPGEVSTPNAPMMAALERRTAGLLHFEMPNGTYLADWTKRQLLDHGRRVLANAQSALRTSYFFIAVAELLPKDDSRVADVLSEVDLERVARDQALIPA